MGDDADEPLELFVLALEGSFPTLFVCDIRIDTVAFDLAPEPRDDDRLEEKRPSLAVVGQPIELRPAPDVRPKPDVERVSAVVRRHDQRRQRPPDCVLAVPERRLERRVVSGDDRGRLVKRDRHDGIGELLDKRVETTLGSLPNADLGRDDLEVAVGVSSDRLTDVGDLVTGVRLRLLEAEIVECVLE
ncbi:hypothetical protein [Natrialba sp. INN-245]|uniref:hypothetical protein n=1 Tax=Natrialba sp. INN-245 TaxID=2690967 RepID=UPI001F2B7C4D|nr:hypothetical protein [Natrialba sp. INN-245]